MSTNRAVVSALNVILKNELTAINQYFLHAKMLKHQGFNKLAETVYAESIDEMKHADQLAERILMIGGLPNFQDLGKLHIGETPKEMLESDLKMELDAFTDLEKSRNVCDKEGDVVSQNLLEEIMDSEEEHRDWLRKQLDVIKAVGVENYLQHHIGD